MTDTLSSSDDVLSGSPLWALQTTRFREPLPLRLGGRIDGLEIAYETWGELSPARDNAVLVCHAISLDSHATRHGPEDQPGWWDRLIGPGKAVDTDRLFVLADLGAEVQQAHFHVDGRELSAELAMDANLHAEGAILQVGRVARSPAGASEPHRE